MTRLAGRRRGQGRSPKVRAAARGRSHDGPEGKEGRGEANGRSMGITPN